MKVKLLDKNIKMPEIKCDGDGGYDIYLPKDIVLLPHLITVVDTGVCVEIPKGYVGMLIIRSSIATKQRIVVQSPLIDSNYRGEIHLILMNCSQEWLEFNKGDRICSLVLFKIDTPKLTQVEELSDSNRGTNWNGSSGK